MSFDAAATGPFGFGTGPLGGLYAAVSDEQAAATLETAWSGGIRYIDTAPHYGAGLAERRLGRFLRGRPREQVIVSTKVGRRLVPGEGKVGDDGFHVETGLVRVWDFTRHGVRRCVEESLERTGLDRFDLVLIHDPDDHWEQAVGEAYPALAEMRDSGAVSAIGVGMNQWQMLSRFVRETDLDAVLVAGRYTLLDRGAADELLPLCQARGVSVVVGGVLNSGVLADPRPGAHFNYQPAPEPVLATARRMRQVCASFGVPLLAAALQFPRRHPAVTGILVGARSPAEVEENLVAAAMDLPAQLWPALEEARS